MVKAELINALRDETGISKQEAVRVVEIFFGEIADALANGDRAEIRGLCSFHVKKLRTG